MVFFKISLKDIINLPILSYYLRQRLCWIQNLAPFCRHFHGQSSVLLSPLVWAWPRDSVCGQRGQRAGPEPRLSFPLAVCSVGHSLEENTPADGPKRHEEHGRPDVPRTHVGGRAVPHQLLCNEAFQMS